MVTHKRVINPILEHSITQITYLDLGKVNRQFCNKTCRKNQAHLKDKRNINYTHVALKAFLSGLYCVVCDAIVSKKYRTLKGELL